MTLGGPELIRGALKGKSSFWPKIGLRGILHSWPEEGGTIWPRTKSGLHLPASQETASHSDPQGMEFTNNLDELGRGLPEDSTNGMWIPASETLS